MSHSGQMRFLSRMGQTTEFCYVGESIQLQIVEAELDGTAFTTATSTTAAVTKEDGTSITSGSFTYTATLPGFDEATPGWYLNTTAPTTAGRIHGHGTIVYSSATGKWHCSIDVRNLT